MKITLTFMDILTLQLLTLKSFNVISCSWFLVFLPFLIKWGSIFLLLLYAKYVISKTANDLNLEVKNFKKTLFKN